MDADVIVVGAGAAGLAAARALSNEDYDVIVLEARNRIGGRVWTDRTWADTALDMGASWIHGSRDNPLSSLVRQFKLKTAITDYDNLWLYDTSGSLVNDDAQDRIDTRLDDLLDELDELRDDFDEEDRDDISLQQAVDSILARRDFSERARRELNYAINATIEHEYGTDIANLSFYYWDDGEEFDGGDLLLPNGFDQVMQGLAAGMDIRLEHVVEHIAYTRYNVTVTTNQGVLTAERVIVTVPLGVLQKGKITFSPPLPRKKQAAMHRLGMGMLNKVYLRFPEVFWEREPDLLGYISERKGEWSEWLNMYKYLGKPILLGFNAGVYGQQLEQLSDTQVVDGAMDVLRRIYGTSIPNPEAWLISRWGTDSYAYGSYSYLRPHATPDDYDLLAAPVELTLFFAGEATSRDYAATVHGALLSGEYAAQLIIEDDEE